jgi:hypothetical protein
MHRKNKKKTDNNSDRRVFHLKKLLELSINWNYVKAINYVFENKEVNFILFCSIMLLIYAGV